MEPLYNSRLDVCNYGVVEGEKKGTGQDREDCKAPLKSNVSMSLLWLWLARDGVEDKASG